MATHDVPRTATPSQTPLNANVSIAETPDDADARLDPLFAAARCFPPSAAEHAWLLRAVPPARATPLQVWRATLLGAQRHWRTISAVAASAAGIVVAVIALVPTASPAFAWERVIAAMESAPVVHVIRDSGSEAWFQRDVFHARRSADGSYVRFHDLRSEVAATYRATPGWIWMQTEEMPEGSARFRSLHTMGDFMFFQEAFSGTPFEALYTVTRSVQQERDVYVLTYIDDPNKVALIDAETNRLLKTPGAVYEYPETPPTGITDLSVPNDVPIIDAIAEPALLALRDRVRDAQDRGFDDYRMVRLSQSHWLRVTQTGERVMVESFRPPADEPTELDDLHHWAELLLAYEDPGLWRSALTVFEGDVEQSTNFDREGCVKYEMSRPAPFHGTWSQDLSGVCWGGRVFFHPWLRESGYVESEDGLVGVRNFGQGNKVSRPWMSQNDYDPQRGYRLARMLHWNDPNATWQRGDWWRPQYIDGPKNIVVPEVDDPPTGFESNVVAWDELRPGEWYPVVTETRDLIADKFGNPVPDPNSPPRYRVVLAEPL